MLFRGIKSRVFIQIWILVFSALFLTQALLFFFFLEITISRTIEQKRGTLVAFSLYQNQEPILKNGAEKFENAFFTGKTHDAMGFQDRFCFLWETLPGTSLDATSQYNASDLCTVVGNTVHTGKASVVRMGKILWLLIPYPEKVIVTIVLEKKGVKIGAGGVETSLVPIYHDFLQLQQVTFVFIMITSLFFSLLGTRQFRRIYFSPLQRLSRKAESYQENDDIFFSVRKEDDEFSVLSLSLNKMLNRISEDKAALKKTISSLEKANGELHKAQNDIIRAEKLATVGRLASGIAHEVGNPLGVVLGYLGLLKQNDLSIGERNDFIRRSEAEISRISHIIRQLLDMSRLPVEASGIVSIHSLLRDLVNVLSCQPAASQIRFEMKLNAKNDRVYGDPEQIRQVFLNIIINAIDVINVQHHIRDGQVVLTTDNAITTDHCDPTITIFIQDNGPGIDPSIRSRLFDPFFTTKEPGKGTGLGLSVSFMIVERFKGTLSVVDTVDSGGGFRILFPLAKTAVDGNETG